MPGSIDNLPTLNTSVSLLTNETLNNPEPNTLTALEFWREQIRSPLHLNALHSRPRGLAARRPAFNGRSHQGRRDISTASRLPINAVKPPVMKRVANLKRTGRWDGVGRPSVIPSKRKTDFSPLIPSYIRYALSLSRKYTHKHIGDNGRPVSFELINKYSELADMFKTGVFDENGNVVVAPNKAEWVRLSDQVNSYTLRLQRKQEKMEDSE